MGLRETGASISKLIDRRRVPISVAIGCLFFSSVLGFLSGILITIKKADGTTATVDAPPGSHTSIDKNGDVHVRLHGTELRRLTAYVVSVKEKARLDLVRYETERRTQVNH
jgi:hypothetical protein